MYGHVHRHVCRHLYDVCVDMSIHIVDDFAFRVNVHITQPVVRVHELWELLVKNIHKCL